MLGRLLPKKTDFFALFSRHAALTVAAAQAFEAMLDRLGDAEADSTRVRALEHEADDVARLALENLHRTFVTPIDRGDIHLLTSRLDDVMDHVESAAQRLWLYEIRVPTAELREMAAHLRRATEAVRGAVDAMADRSKPERVRELCLAVKQVEKENDRLLRRTMAKIFREESDAKALIKWKEIYETVEAAIDLCEDAANVIEGVVLENA